MRHNPDLWSYACCKSGLRAVVRLQVRYISHATARQHSLLRTNESVSPFYTVLRLNPNVLPSPIVRFT